MVCWSAAGRAIVLRCYLRGDVSGESGGGRGVERGCSCARKGRSAQLADMRACAWAGRDGRGGDGRLHGLSRGFTGGEWQRKGEEGHAGDDRQQARDEMRFKVKTDVSSDRQRACLFQTRAPVIWILPHDHGWSMDSCTKGAGLPGHFDLHGRPLLNCCSYAPGRLHSALRQCMQSSGSRALLQVR